MSRYRMFIYYQFYQSTSSTVGPSEVKFPSSGIPPGIPINIPAPSAPDEYNFFT